MARRVNLAQVEAELRDAVEGLAMGQADPRMLPGSIKLACATILHRHGLGHSKVHVRRVGAGLDVQVQFPPTIPGVQQIRLNISR